METFKTYSTVGRNTDNSQSPTTHKPSEYQMIVSNDLIIKSFDTGFQLSVWLSLCLIIKGLDNQTQKFNNQIYQYSPKILIVSLFSIGSLDLLLSGFPDPSNPIFTGTTGISVSCGSTIITPVHYPLSASSFQPYSSTSWSPSLRCLYGPPVLTSSVSTDYYPWSLSSQHLVRLFL